MRERLIELLKHEFGTKVSEITADYLLANGIIVPPCKVGDTVYYITGIYNSLIRSAEVIEIYCSDSGFAYRVSSDYVNFDLQQSEIYFTKEEAEQALKERFYQGKE